MFDPRELSLILMLCDKVSVNGVDTIRAVADLSVKTEAMLEAMKRSRPDAAPPVPEPVGDGKEK